MVEGKSGIGMEGAVSLSGQPVDNSVETRSQLESFCLPLRPSTPSRARILNGDPA